MKNKLPFDVTPRGGARTYTHTRTRTVGSRIVWKETGVHRNEIYEGRGDLLEERHVRTGAFFRGGRERRMGKNVGALSAPRVCIHTFTRVHV